MNKQEFLKDYKKQEDKLCLSQVLDKIEFCESREKIGIYRFFRYVSGCTSREFSKKN